jgi:hypothetical protein
MEDRTMADETQAERRRAPEKASEGFKVLDWDGHDLYQCNDCAYDTMTPLLMDQHQNIAHGRLI